jgi:hypothetical protein
MSYTGTTPKDLDNTKPDGATEYGNILDDAVKELKTVFLSDHKVRSTAVGVTVAVTDSIILCTDTLTITLPSASTLAGADPNAVTRIKEFQLINSGSGTVTISGTVIISGTSTVNPTLVSKEQIHIWTDGTSYYGIKYCLTPVANAVPILGLNGGYVQPGSGGETLKIIRGKIASDGTTQEGTGFTSSRSATGIYGIAYTTAFSDVPAVCATLQTTIGFIHLYNGGSAAAVDIKTFNASSAATDMAFEFIAIGPA